MSAERITFECNSMLWTCAKKGCTLLLSEDFQYGRTLKGVRFYNSSDEPLVGGHSLVSPQGNRISELFEE
jgi:hypothetical protein